jgi:hypothetical protein
MVFKLNNLLLVWAQWVIQWIRARENIPSYATDENLLFNNFICIYSNEIKQSQIDYYLR